MFVYGTLGTRRGLAHLALLGMAGLLLAACFSRTPSPAAESTATAPEIQVTLLPADQQEGGSLALRLTDVTGTPITDATVRLEGDMNHAGMIPVISDPAEHTGDGIYRTPFEFTMLGEWIISVFITLADGTEHLERIDMSVNSEGLDIP